MADNEQQAPIDPVSGEMPPGEENFPAPENDGLQERVSAVSEGSNKTKIIAGVIAVVLVYGIYNLLFVKSTPPPPKPKPTEATSTGAVADANTVPSMAAVGGDITAPPLPPVPPPLPPAPPSAPPSYSSSAPQLPMPGGGSAMGAMPSFPSAPGGGQGMLPPAGGGGAPGPLGPAGGRRSMQEASEAEKQRLRANMMLQGGSGRYKTPPSAAQGIVAPTKADGGPQTASTPGAPGTPGTPGAKPPSSVKTVGNPELMIAQGKIISAVLETAINTDLPGALRAVVSRDVYAEQGKHVLIPRGSRLIGSYNTDIKRGQARVYIVWNRLIMPNGHDMSLGSPATDSLGRSGFEGHVDNKYFELFSNSLLLSSMSVGFAVVVGAATNSQSIQQGQTGSGDATTSGNVVDIATLNAVKDFSSQVQDVVKQNLQINPTITVNQGENIKIFVNRDIFIPEDLAFTLSQPETGNAEDRGFDATQ